MKKQYKTAVDPVNLPIVFNIKAGLPPFHSPSLLVQVHISLYPHHQDKQAYLDAFFALQYGF
jgi:hypothetical protein